MIVFVWRRQPPPGFTGGAELTEAGWAAALASLGHEVVFVGCDVNPRDHRVSERAWLAEMLRYEGIVADERCGRLEYEWRGVKCFCVPQIDVLRTAAAMLATKPHLLWTSQEGCDEIASLRTRPTRLVTYAHSVSDVGILSGMIGADFVLAPSEFAQRVLLQRTGCHSTLARPSIVGPTKGVYPRAGVLLVNPIREKGVALAISLAKTFPAQQFHFVEAWRQADVAPCSLPPNVELLPRQPSLAHLYSRTLVLIVPSVVPDAAPRVVSEAGIYGVPVIGSNRGGIGELVAHPDINCLPPWSIRAWRHRLKELLTSAASWQSAMLAQRQLTATLVVEPVVALENAGILRVLQ